MCGGWIKDHKKELLAAAAIAGVGAATGGFGLLGAGAAAGAAGGTAAGAAGAAGAVAGDAFLPGLLAGASGFPEAAAITAGAAGAEGAVAGDAFLPGLIADAPGSGIRGGGLLGSLGKGAGRFGRAAHLAQIAGGGQQEPQPQFAPMPQGQQTVPAGASAPSIAETYPIDVIDPEKRRRMLALARMYGGRNG
jgi:hypothetical protein